MLVNIKNSIRSYLLTKKYISHCKENFFVDKNVKSDANMLVEFNKFNILHIIFPYLINFFSKKKTYNVIGYHSHYLLSYPIFHSFLGKLKISLGMLFSIRNFGIYKSFGVKKFLIFIKNNHISSKAEKEVIKQKKKLKSKKDILKIKKNGIYIGDLIYDTYLKKKYDLEPTIDLSDNFFWEFLFEFYVLFFNWENYFKENKIEIVIASHATYTIGLPLRFCLNNNGTALVVKENEIIRLSKSLFYQTSHYKFFPKIFKNFKKKNKKKYLNIAKEKINQRIKGSTKDLPYMTNSSFKVKPFKQVLNKNRKFKVLIAAHDFVDGPHFSGNFIFPDIYEWLNFVIKLSKSIDYDWYIKLHPKMDSKWRSYQDYTSRVIEKMCKKSNIKILPRDISHNDIISSGINLALTVNGSIAHEYALKGVKVINASPNNPHASYNFNYHAKSIKDYVDLLKKAPRLKKKMKKKDIYEYYFMRYVYKSSNWFFEDYNIILNKLEDYHDQWSPKIYNIWMQDCSKKKDDLIYKKIDKFINNKYLTYYNL